MASDTVLGVLLVLAAQSRDAVHPALLTTRPAPIAAQEALEVQAAAAADQQGIRTVNAPGFKRWITDTLATSSSALVTASVIGCIRPWWVGALAAFQSAFDVIYSLASRVVGAVITLGEVALKVPDALDDLLTIAKWGLGLGGAAWLIYEVSKAKKAGTSIL